MKKDEQAPKQVPALKIKEALEFYQFANPKRERLQEIELARVIYADDAKPKSLSVKMSNLTNGKVQRVAPEWVRRICQATGVDANFLFDVEPMSTKLSTQFKNQYDETD